MNLVVDDAVEVRLATKSEEEKRRNLGIFHISHVPKSCLWRTRANAAIELGQILLKGDNVSLIQTVQ